MIIDFPINCRIEVRVEKYGIEKKEFVTIEKDKTSKLDIEIPNGNLKIKTEPKEARVYVNNKLYGDKTPIELKNVPAGNYFVEVTMSRPPYTSKELYLQVKNNETTSEKIVLKKKPFYKTWWFWGIVGGIAGGAAAGGGGGGGGGDAAAGSGGSGGGTTTGSVTVGW